MNIVPFDCLAQDRDELLEELDYEVGRNGLEYADTYRATPIDQGYAEHAQKVGCCGVYETHHKCRSGNMYYLGCNYGH